MSCNNTIVIAAIVLNKNRQHWIRVIFRFIFITYRKMQICLNFQFSRTYSKALGFRKDVRVFSSVGQEHAAAARHSRTRASLALSSANAQLLSQLRAAAADAQICLWNCIVVIIEF